MQRNFNALLEKYIQSSYLYSNYNFFGSRLFTSVHIQVKCSFSGCMCSLYPKRKNSGRIRCNQKRRRIGGESTNGLVSLKNRVSLPWTHDLSYKWTNMWEWVLSARAIIYCGGGWKKWKQIIIFPLTHPLWPSVCTDSIPHSIYLVCTLDDLRENRRCVNRLLDSFVITFIIIHPCCAMGS